MSSPVPNTSIVCATCEGETVNPAHGHQCGACFGTGLSTAPWDQRQYSTTVTVWDGDTLQLPTGCKIVGTPQPVRGTHGGHHRQGERVTITWPNPSYKGT